MSDELSMREVARQLGVSQIRVRELIRKGTISAEKITEAGHERWAISEESVSRYRARRDAENGTATMAGGPASTPERRAEAVAPDDPSAAQAPAGASLPALVTELAKQAERIRTLIAEIEKASAYLDGLRAAHRSIETELARARERAGPQTTPPSPPAETGAPVSEPQAAAPKKAAKKPASKQKGGGPKASGGTEMKDAAPQSDAPSEGMKGAGPVVSDAKEPSEAGKAASEPGKKAASGAGKKAAAEGKRAVPEAGETAVSAALREAGVEPPKKTTKKKRTTKKSSGSAEKNKKSS